MASFGQPMKYHRGFILSSLILGLSLIACTLLIGSTFLRAKGLGQTISVTGAAYKPITSDFATWSGRVTTTAPTLAMAYAKLIEDLNVVQAFLRRQGFDEENYEVSTVAIRKVTNRDREIKEYNLSQSIRIELDDVERITRIAKESSSLIEKGIEFESMSPAYIFTGLNPLKLEMIKAATENAKLRAAQLAESTGRKVGTPRSARVGVFQIRPLHSQAVSDYGINDRSSIDKEIVCTVHINFTIE